ncbi:MAG: hypothetical protein AAF936_08910 [Pseudomonadota bacterium]
MSNNIVKFFLWRLSLFQGQKVTIDGRFTILGVYMHRFLLLIALLATAVSPLSPLAQNAHAQLFGKGGEDILRGLGKKVVEPAVGCGYLGAAAGSITQDRDVAKWSGIGSAALCTALSLEMDRQRIAALKREQELDEAIAQQKISNDELVAENEKLRLRLNELQQKANRLEDELRTNPDNVLRLTAEIQREKDSAKERLEVVDDRLEFVNEIISNDQTSHDERTRQTEIRRILLERREILIATSNIVASSSNS